MAGCSPTRLERGGEGAREGGSEVSGSSVDHIQQVIDGGRPARLSREGEELGTDMRKTIDEHMSGQDREQRVRPIIETSRKGFRPGWGLSSSARVVENGWA